MRLRLASSAPQPVPVLPVRLERKPRGRRRRLVAVVLVLVLLAVAGFVVYLHVETGGPTTIRNALTVQSGIIGVAQGTYNDYPFTVPATAKSPVFSGTFKLQGGSSALIVAYVMNASVYARWSAAFYNGTSMAGLPYNYDSGKVHSASISVPLSAGVAYYLVFDDVQPFSEVVQVSASVLGV